MLTAVGPKIVIFNHLVLVDDSVTIQRCPNLVVDLKVSVALQKPFARLRAHFGHPPKIITRVLHEAHVHTPHKHQGEMTIQYMQLRTCVD